MEYDPGRLEDVGHPPLEIRPSGDRGWHVPHYAPGLELLPATGLRCRRSAVIKCRSPGDILQSSKAGVWGVVRILHDDWLYNPAYLQITTSCWELCRRLCFEPRKFSFMKLHIINYPIILKLQFYMMEVNWKRILEIPVFKIILRQSNLIHSSLSYWNINQETHLVYFYFFWLAIIVRLLFS